MNESIIAVRYAKALYQLAQEKKLADEVYKDMTTILAIAHEVPEFQNFLESPIIKPSNKIKISSSIFQSFNALTTTFLATLYNNRRELYLCDVARKYVSVINTTKKITVATLKTTVTLEPETKAHIIDVIKKKFKAENVELTEQIDENLIGGFIVRVNDQQLDASISTNLREIKRKLLKTPVK